MESKNKPNLNTKYTLSYELLYLLDWIIEHEYETVKSIITHALQHDGQKKLRELSKCREFSLEEEAQTTILDFLALIETAYIDVANEDSIKNVLERSLLPAIDHIDISQCDNNTLAATVAQTSFKIEQNPQANPQEILFKELLKQWKPSKTVHDTH